uniref:Uncharacterized protein n=1 Tax=Anguilla anguilla TaxID=7936 RepID=A0A0E9VTD6_ANGAN
MKDVGQTKWKDFRKALSNVTLMHLCGGIFTPPSLSLLIL